jgi:glycosyltransferase involved in cell wall biosynthesis
VRVDAEAMSVEPLLRRDAFGPLSRFVRQFRPDVLNSHLFRSTAAAAPVAAWYSVPIVETYHGREGWRRGLVRGRFLPDRLVARLVDRVIAVSEAARTFLVEGKGYPAPRSPSSPTAVTSRSTGPEPGARRHAASSVSAPPPGGRHVGRLDAQKGHTYLLDAWPAVQREMHEARLLLVGDGGLRQPLEQRVRELGLADSVIFVGFRTDVPQMLDAMDVMVLPSLYEGMPLTAIEASAMARPVVATDVDGTPEVVRRRAQPAGWSAADPAALTHAMLDLLRDPDGARRMGQAGRERVLAALRRRPPRGGHRRRLSQRGRAARPARVDGGGMTGLLAFWLAAGCSSTCGWAIPCCCACCGDGTRPSRSRGATRTPRALA